MKLHLVGLKEISSYNVGPIHISSGCDTTNFPFISLQTKKTEFLCSKKVYIAAFEKMRVISEAITHSSLQITKQESLS